MMTARRLFVILQNIVDKSSLAIMVFNNSAAFAPAIPKLTVLLHFGQKYFP
jgi:hypothetical protein